MTIRILFFSILVLIFTTGEAQTKKKASSKKSSTNKTVKKITEVKDSVSNPYYIVIDKSDYELRVYDDTGWLATYPVVFGSKDLSDKMYEGDKRTPDGEYKVLLKKTNKQWGLELLLDYPTPENVKIFNQRKADGKIPKNKRIGSGIAIHGTRPGSEWTVDNYVNWTDGCISVKYSEMKELYELIPQGTKVTIQQ
jgi:murein L,D-transpeptidase YafK